MRSLRLWLLIWLGWSTIVGAVVSLRSGIWPPDIVLIEIALASGAIVTLVVGVLHAASSLDAARQQRFHDDDPNWHYLTISRFRAFGYVLAIVVCVAFAVALGVGFWRSGYFVPRENFTSWLPLALFAFPAALALINLPTTLFALFSEWRWNEEELQRRNPLVGVRSDRFDSIRSAGIWPLVGLIGIRFHDGSVARIHQEVLGMHGLYSRLRRHLGDRFWGLSFEMENALAEMGLDREGRPLQDDDS